MIASAKNTVDAAPLYAALTSILIALALIVGLFEAVGVDPLLAASVMWKSTFGSLRTFGEGLVRATPLLMISATLLPSLRAGLYNIGAPGQLGAGALATTLVALSLPSASSWIVVPLCAIAAFFAGGATAFVPGLLKAHWRVNEIVSTLAMNFIVVAVLGISPERPAAERFRQSSAVAVVATQQRAASPYSRHPRSYRASGCARVRSSIARVGSFADRLSLAPFQRQSDTSETRRASIPSPILPG